MTRENASNLARNFSLTSPLQILASFVSHARHDKIDKDFPTGPWPSRRNTKLACIRADSAVSTTSNCYIGQASSFVSPASACFWRSKNILTPTAMVNDDPSTAQDVWKATMSVTKSCCCKELEMRWREGGGFCDRALGRCHVDWIGPSMCSWEP
jgi:hypothetical protein